MEAYVTYVRTGNLVFTSGQLPWKGDKLVYLGKVGSDLTVEEGYQASRLSALNDQAQLHCLEHTCDLHLVEAVVDKSGGAE